MPRRTGTCLSVAALVLFLGPACGAVAQDKDAAIRRLIKCVMEMDMALEDAGYCHASLQAEKRDLEAEMGNDAEHLMKAVKKGKRPDVRRLGALRMCWYAGDKEIKPLLVSLLGDEDQCVAFNAARALAFQGFKEGVPLLRKTAKGEFAVSQSGFELDRAALALLVLSEKLPKGFKPGQERKEELEAITALLGDQMEK